MTTHLKEKKLWIGVALLIVLFVLINWGYTILFENYGKIELSHSITETFLGRQIRLTQKNEGEIELLKRSLNQTEILLRNVRVENDKLREQIQLLDEVAQLQGTIGELKDKSSLLSTQIDTIERQQSIYGPNEIITVQHGRTILARLKGMIRDVHKKIQELQHREHQQRITAQKEMDRIKSLAGNNGFIIRDGKLTPPHFNFDLPEKRITVEVKFVQ